jgi:hypothetical protein
VSNWQLVFLFGALGAVVSIKLFGSHGGGMGLGSAAALPMIASRSGDDARPLYRRALGRCPGRVSAHSRRGWAAREGPAREANRA